MTTIYDINTCSTVRKARQWLDQQQLPYRYHDLRRDGLDAEMLQHWIDALGWEVLVNRQGMTWRKLSAAERQLDSASQAKQLMLAHPTLIKRPVLEHQGKIHVGFQPEQWQDYFA